MHREALQRLTDAEVLHRASAIDAPSDSVHLLQLLGLELLLKLVHQVVLQEKSKHRHAYEQIFQALPAQLQSRLLKLAGDRIGPSALSRNAISVLKEWGKNFIDLRYPYERYESLTEDQYAALGKQWVEKGRQSKRQYFGTIQKSFSACFTRSAWSPKRWLTNHSSRPPPAAAEFKRWAL